MSGETTKSKSASKRKQPESDVVDESAIKTEPKQKKQKKSKDKSEKQVVGEQELTEPVTEESKETKKSKKASKKAKKEEPEVPVAGTETAPVNSTEEKTEAPVEQEEPVTKDDATEAATSGEVPKKKKERKRNKNNRKQTGQDEAANKTDTGNGTPEEDASLTEQAQKGIQYAWLYTHRNLKSLPEGEAKDDGTYWKFNKARQGWLWKNVWNEEIIPSKYVELVIGYLSSMQGQARQKLMEEAQKIVDTPVMAAAEPAKEEATTAVDDGEEKNEEEAAEDKEEPAVEAETEAEAEAEAEVKPESVSAEKHRRAQLVVESLRS